MAAVAEVEAQKVEGKKGVEGFIRSRLLDVQTRVEGLTSKVREQVAELRKGFQPKQTLERVKAALKVERFDKIRELVLAKAPVAQVEKAVADTVKLTEDAVQKLGLAKLADVSALKDAFEGLAKKIDQLRKKVDGLTRSAPAGGAEATTAAAAAPAEAIKAESSRND